MRGMKTLSVAVTLLTLSGVGLSSGSPVQEDGVAALLTAAGEGRVDDVRALLDGGVDVNARNDDGWTPLLYAALGGHPDVVALLLEYGADVNASNDVGWTPLIGAAMSGRAEVVRVLLDHGADPEARSMRTPDGDSAVTALIVGARYGHADVVSALLDGGAEVNATSRNSLSPVAAAASGGHSEVMTLLVERGADISAPASDPSMTAAQPEVRDRARFGQLIARNYPENLRNTQVGGTVRVWALVGTDGRVTDAEIRESSGHQALDLAALSTVREIEFIPAHRDGVPVAAWVDFPITFEAPHTVGPQLREPWRMWDIILSHYPRHLQEAGIGGTVHVSVLIDTSGRVQNARIVRSSGRGALDAAALRAVREFLFTPAYRNGAPVPMWMQIPITFPENR
ncbi:MAG: TonB family protein [Gemmatimonadales bacterium]|jgi:TonB family protein